MTTTMRLKLPAIRKAVQAMPWAILPERGAAMLDLITLRAEGVHLSAEEVKARIGDMEKPVATKAGAIQVLQLFGVIAHRMDLFTEISGGTSTERFADQFDAAMADPSISAIVINVDSPGGSVDGVPELAKRIYDARGKGKKIVAVSNTLMASAAYWIASAADEVVATPSAMVGSIGVFMVHMDESGMDEQLGLTYSLISAGKYKTEGNPYEPLSDEARGALQVAVDEYYDLFVGAVAKHRGVKATDVRKGYGEGRCLTAKQALAASLIDRIDTLEGVLSKLGARNVSLSGRPRQTGASARDVAITQDPQATREHPDRLPFVAGAIARADDANAPTCSQCGAELVPNDGDEDDLLCPNGCTPTSADETDDSDTEAVTSPAVGAAAASGALPESTSPAPTGQESPMAPNATAAPTGAGNEGAAFVAAERRRVSDIRSLGRTHRLEDSQIDAMIDEGVSIEAASSRILSIVGERHAASPTVRVGNERAADKPFASFSEQLVAAVQAGIPGRRVDPRLARVNHQAMQFLAGTPSGMDESVGSEGGFFIQPDLLPGVIDPIYAEDPILSRVTRIPIGANSSSVKYNVVDETARTTGNRWGGIQMYWAAEADQATASKPKLRQMQLDLKKLIGLAYLTDELTQDAPAAQALLGRAFQAELAFMLAVGVFKGTGGGQMQGFLNSGALVTQAIEGGQTIANSDASIALNTAKMMSRVPAGLLGELIWLYNPDLFPTLLVAKLGGTSVPAFVPMSGGAAGRPFDTIWGRAAYPSEMCEAVGTPGDIVAVVPSQYHMADKGGPQQAVSLHVRFLFDELTLRITYRTDGAPVWKQTVTAFKGGTARSPFVVLNTRS